MDGWSLTARERAELESIVSRPRDARQLKRAQGVLALAEGEPATQVARRLRGWRIVLFLDRGSPHTAQASRRPATRLGVEVRWLPTACPELNPVEGLWRWLKGAILCNSQAERFDDTVSRALDTLASLPPCQVRRTAGFMSENFWLRT